MGQQRGCAKQGRHKPHCQSYLAKGKREANRIRRLNRLLAKAIRRGYAKPFISQTQEAISRWEKCSSTNYGSLTKGRLFKL